MFWTALLFGLLGSFHCVGMCGPIAFLLPLDRKSASRRWLQLSSYHLGRLCMYSLIGLFFGFLGKRIGLFGFQQQLSIIIGVLMILLVLLPTRIFNRFSFSKPFYRFAAKLKNALGKSLTKRDPGTFFTLGYLNGLLPCGLVYMAIFGALASEGVWEGGVYMFLFGLGTVPLMTTAIYMGNFLTVRLRKRMLKLVPVFVGIIGLLFILRGMGLGIKYLSPSEMVTQEKVEARYECH
ncbi:sulfite exporter TauE/SafE family protein [Spongiimicrobium salis]|uniref:sulfite exporter TauE/SafE family protein n=1 Tax=Spongiimicrobium salis TaxID=1667022 RepID=UPI00374CA7F5